jgi:hypothetical protein
MYIIIFRKKKKRVICYIEKGRNLKEKNKKEKGRILKKKNKREREDYICKNHI